MGEASIVLPMMVCAEPDEVFCVVICAVVIEMGHFYPDVRVSLAKTAAGEWIGALNLTSCKVLVPFLDG
jgi:hypothetical protein